ncbi:MAG: hypothetical protein ACFE8L_10225 [Candidatus Hodarchaeota archaeon]
MKKFVSLLSGGLDSPVATFIIINKKFHPIFLSFLTSEDKNHSMKEKVIQIVKILKMIIKNEVKLYLINHDPNLELFRTRSERKLTCILCKRLMLRIAMQIGKIENTNLIVTGDILGEQASQTLDNLFAYNNLFRNFTILRPLIGWDKLEVIKLSEKIGLYNICSQSSASCQYNPQFPETHAKPLEIIEAESTINLGDLVKESIKNVEILYL